MNSWRRRAAPWLALLAGLAGCDCSETPETDDETSEAVAPPGPGHVPITCQPDFLLDAAGRCVRWVRLGGLSRDRHAGALIHVGAGRVLAVGGMAKPDFAARKAETEPPPPPPYADAELYDSATHRQVMSFALGAPRARPLAALLPEEKALVVGGFREWNPDTQKVEPNFSYDVLDLTTGTVATHPLPEGAFAHALVPLADGSILLVGSTQTTGEEAASAFAAWRFDPAAGRLEAVAAPTPSPQWAEAWPHPDGALLVGQSAAKQPVTLIWQQSDQSWIKAPPPPGKTVSRRDTAVLTDGTVVLMQGYDFKDVGKLEMLAFEPERKAWRKLAPLKAKYVRGLAPTPAGGLLAGAGFDQLARYDRTAGRWTSRKWEGPGIENLVAAGPERMIVLHEGGAVTIIDPATGEALPGPGSGGYGTRTIAEPKDGKLVVARKHRDLVQLSVLDLASGRWAAAPAGTPVPPRRGVVMPETPFPGPKRHDHATTFLADGRLLLCGGIATKHDFREDTWLFDPKDKQWTQLANAPETFWSHDLAQLPDGGVLTVDRDPYAAIFSVEHNAWLPTVPPPTKMGSTTLEPMGKTGVLVFGTGVSDEGAAIFEVGATHLGAPPMGPMPGQKARAPLAWSAGLGGQESKQRLRWDERQDDAARAKCFVGPGGGCPARATSTRPLPLALEPDPSTERLDLTPRLVPRDSRFRYQMTVHLDQKPGADVDVYAQLDLSEQLGAPDPKTGRSPLTTTLDRLHGVANASLIGAVAMPLPHQPLTMRASLGPEGDMQDVKVETTGPAGSERTVQQQLSLVTRALAGLRKPAKPVSVGKRWSASLDLDVSSLLNRDDIKADVSTQAEATYRFAGWRKQGDSRLAAVEVRVDISLRGTVATDRFSWRIGQVGRATGVFYWDPERAEPAYVELVATAYQLLDDKRVETIARLFGTRLGDTAGP